MPQIETPISQLPIPAEAVERERPQGRYEDGRGGGQGGGPGGRPPRWWSAREVDFHRGLMLGLVITAVWLVVCLGYIIGYVGWDALAYLLPHELASVLSAIFAPLGVLWLALFYLRRGSEMTNHAAALQAELRRLTYPDSQADARIEMISAALRRQAEELTQASEQATDQVRQVESLLRQRVEDIGRSSTSSNARTAALVEELGGRARALEGSAERLAEQGEQINEFLEGQASNFEASVAQSQHRAEIAANVLNAQTEALAEAMDRAEARAETLTENTMAQADRLSQHYDARLAEIEQTAEQAQQILAQRADHLADGVVHSANEMEQKFNQTIDHMDGRAGTWSEEAMARADQIRQHYGTRLNEIERTGQQTQTTIAARSAQMAADLQKDLADMETGFDTSIDHLTERAGGMKDEAKAGADSISQHFEDRLNAIAQGADESQATLSTRSEAMAQDLTRNLEQMARRFDQNIDELTQRGTDMTEAATLRADEMHNYYGEKLGEIEQQSVETQAAIAAQNQRMAGHIQQNLTTMTEAFDLAVDGMNNRSDDLRDTALERVEQLRLQYLEKLAAIEQSTEQAHGAMFSRADRLANGMETNLNDLADHVNLSVDRLESRTGEMTTNAMAEAEHMRRHYGEQMAEIDQAATQTQKTVSGRAKDMADGMRVVVDGLGQDYRQSLDQLTVRTGEMTDQALASAEQIRQHYAQQLLGIEAASSETQKTVAGQAVHMADGVLQTVGEIGQEIDQTIDRLESRISGTGERIRVQTDDLRTATIDATEQAVRRMQEMSTILLSRIDRASGD
nr:hypothetical protein [Alphaproteobacteria bacterium]